jgi:signal transduction histidine kinase
VTLEKDKSSNLFEALVAARLLVRDAPVLLAQRAIALSVIEEIDRALATLDPRGKEAENNAAAPSALARERADRVEAEGAQRRAEFLYEATSALFEAPLEPAARCEKLTRLAVPDLADWCLCDLLDGTQVERVAVGHWNPDGDALARGLVRSYPLEPAATRGISRVLTTRQAELEGDLPPLRARSGALPDEASEGDFENVLRTLGARSYLVVPLIADGRLLGALTFLFAESSRRYGPHDLRLAEDLGRRAALAQQNAALFTQLQRAVSSREEMVAVVSHDLRNPLSSIKLAASLQQQAEGEAHHPKAKSAIILRAVGRMEALLHDLLDAASIDAGTLAIRPSSVEIEAVVAEAIDAIEPSVRDKRLIVSRSVERAIVLLADPDRLLQVLGNLLGNAAKFARQGDRIDVRVERAGSFCAFTIRDSGPGIAASHVPHIFDRFWQGHARSREGAGLGLAIAKGIVDAHGGTLAVVSREGEGTQFDFTIPLAPAPRQSEA